MHLGVSAFGFAAGIGLGYILARSSERIRQAPSSSGITGSILFLYSDCLDTSKQFWGSDVGLPLMADKGVVFFYKLPGSGGSLAIVKQGVSAAASPPVHGIFAIITVTTISARPRFSVDFENRGTGHELCPPALLTAGLRTSDTVTQQVCARDAGRDAVMLCLLTADVDGWAGRIAARGHPVVQPQQQSPRFGIRNALLRSPEGYLLELQQFSDPAEHRRFTV